MNAPTSSNSFFRERGSRKLAAIGLACACLAAVHGGPVAAAPVRVPSPEVDSVRLGGLSGLLDFFRNRDPLKKVVPDQLYKTKYGIITGREYEERVLAERVKSYEAALRAGETPGADPATVRRAKQVEKKLKKEGETAAAARQMLASDGDKRAAAETVLAASEGRTNLLPSPQPSPQSVFKRGISSYRSPTREQLSASKPVGRISFGFLKPKSREKEAPAAEPSALPPPSDAEADREPSRFAATKPQRTAASAAEATVAGRTSAPGRGGVASELAAVERVTAAETPAVSAPPAPPAKKTAASATPSKQPATPSKQPAPPSKQPAPANVELAAAKKKAIEAPAVVPQSPQPSHARMSSKDKLNMAVFGEAKESPEPDAAGSGKPEKAGAAAETARTAETPE